MSIIKKAREQKKLSQAGLAKQIGCSQKHISSLERGEKSASPAIAKKLSEILNINVLNILYPETNSHAEKMESIMVMGLEKAVQKMGTQSALARELGLRKCTVNSWLKGRNKIPAETAVRIEQVTGVSRKELRPDLWD